MMMYSSGILMEKPELRTEYFLCELFASTIAYSLCTDLSNHVLPGYHLSGIQEYLQSHATAFPTVTIPLYLTYKAGQDDLKLFDSLVQYLSEMILFTHKESRLLNCLLISFLGQSSTFIISAQPNSSLGIHQRQWMKYQLPPILSLPLFDVFVVTQALNNLPFKIDYLNLNTRRHHENEDDHEENEEDDDYEDEDEDDDGSSQIDLGKEFLPWIVISKFIQLFLNSAEGQMDPFTPAVNNNNTNINSKEEATEDHQFSAKNYSCLLSFLDLMKQCMDARNSLPIYFQKENTIGLFLLNWLEFIRAIIHFDCRLYQSHQSTSTDHASSSSLSSSPRYSIAKNYLHLCTQNHRNFEIFMNPLTLNDLNDEIILLHLRCIHLDWITELSPSPLPDETTAYLMRTIDFWLQDHFSYTAAFEAEKKLFMDFLKGSSNTPGASSSNLLGLLAHGLSSRSNFNPSAGGGGESDAASTTNTQSSRSEGGASGPANPILPPPAEIFPHLPLRSPHALTGGNSSASSSSVVPLQSILFVETNKLPFYDQLPEKISYPKVHRPTLIQLPDDYSKLHSMVFSKCGNEYPALCLLCGAVINASGKGQCHAHIYSCNAGMGIFFLIQVLLSYLYLSHFMSSHHHLSLPCHRIAMCCSAMDHDQLTFLHHMLISTERFINNSEESHCD
jgi:hypothetical protein